MPIMLSVYIPEYRSGEKPDPIIVGTPIDRLLVCHFSSESVVLRCVGLQDHPELTLDKLAEIVTKTGTDRYDENRKGVGYKNMPDETNLSNTIYGQTVDVDKDTAIMSEMMVYDFYYGTLSDREYSIRIDLVIVYNRSHLMPVKVLHEGTDGFRFRYPTNKPAAVLGIIKILQ